MRMTTLVSMTLLATVLSTAWAITQMTGATNATPAEAPAAMNPFDMMMNAGTMPVHVNIDAI